MGVWKIGMGLQGSHDEFSDRYLGGGKRVQVDRTEAKQKAKQAAKQTADRRRNRSETRGENDTGATTLYVEF